MALCPSCQNQIDISSEFFGGLYTCPLCKSVYFIGFDGTPEVSVNAEEKPYEAQLDTSGFVAEYNTAPMPPSVVDDSVESLSSEVVTSNSGDPPGLFQDVIDFGNSEGATSISSYSLVIKGLEDSQVRLALREVFSDSKLQINYEKIKGEIKNGILRLDRLDPAKAAVLAFRLRPLPLELNWEQSLQ